MRRIQILFKPAVGESKTVAKLAAAKGTRRRAQGKAFKSNFFLYPFRNPKSEIRILMNLQG
jgi:hypothetical protein